MDTRSSNPCTPIKVCADVDPGQASTSEEVWTKYNAPEFHPLPNPPPIEEEGSAGGLVTSGLFMTRSAKV
jgi:hypothetical protein